MIRLAQRDDREAMNELLKLVRPFFECVARDFVDSSRASRSVSDLVQEAEVLAWQNIGKFEGAADDAETSAMFRAWVRRLVQRLAKDVKRKRHAERRRAPGRGVLPLDARKPDAANESAPRRIDPASKGSTASAKLFSTERAQRVQVAIDELPEPEDRSILRAFFFEGLSLRAIAERLDLPYSTVKERNRRGVRQLEQKLKDLWKV